MTLATSFLVFGALFLVGLAADEIGRRTPAPRVTALILIGVAAGPSGFDLLPEIEAATYEFLAAAALSVVAFLLGGELRRDRLRREGAAIMIVSVVLVVASAGLIAGGLVALGAPPAVALALAAMSAATDPAAVVDVVRQRCGARPQSAFARLLLGVVAVDDALGLIVFSFALAAASSVASSAASSGVGGAPGGGAIVFDAVREIAGAVALGLFVGVPAAALTGRVRPGEPTMAEALGVVFFTTGAAMALDVSFLLAGMTVGFVIANFARHHTRPFHEIERIEWPFLLLFFVLAGAGFDVSALGEVGLIGAAYVGLRIAARLIGGAVGGACAGLGRVERRWLGAALTPQAGVAIGMALVAGDRFPQHAELFLTVAVASTILFEIAGPVATGMALDRVGASRSPRGRFRTRSPALTTVKAPSEAREQGEADPE